MSTTNSKPWDGPPRVERSLSCWPARTPGEICVVVVTGEVRRSGAEHVPTPAMRRGLRQGGWRGARHRHGCRRMCNPQSTWWIEIEVTDCKMRRCVVRSRPVTAVNGSHGQVQDGQQVCMACCNAITSCFTPHAYRFSWPSGSEEMAAAPTICLCCGCSSEKRKNLCCLGCTYCCHDDTCFILRSCFTKKTKTFQDFLSHRILRHMHGALNIVKNKN